MNVNVENPKKLTKRSNKNLERLHYTKAIYKTNCISMYYNEVENDFQFHL